MRGVILHKRESMRGVIVHKREYERSVYEQSVLEERTR
jgi:hypothetical protein